MYLSHSSVKYRGPAIVVVMAATLLLLGGCSTVSTGNWQEPRTTNIPYDNILIIGVTPDADMRLELEQHCAEGINVGVTRATKSIYLEPDVDHPPQTQASLHAMLNKTGADAVLVIRVLSKSVKAGKTQAEAYINIGPQITVIQDPGVTEVWLSNYTIHQTDGQLIAKTDSRMEAFLYDVKDNGRGVYKISVETKIEENGGDPTYVVASNVATEITKDLRQDGLIH
jgi:hypothetical protein